ncbi:MAG: hypothetical protein GYB49_07795 [Alphaproteobacteria bacterium]|nr:hypothetical protein [Hyphomonas sp.]MBR9807106.1 hypothetical protein [Alphaproteobacteria bacterium]|tara:strand:+ start:82 stop:519 length:438 start_codon:yes stop_codon:yes gene_type:complete
MKGLFGLLSPKSRRRGAPRVQLAPGQVWTFQDQPVPEARLVIGKVETPWPDNPDVAVSVSIVGLPKWSMENGELVGGTIGHLPFDEATLLASLDQQMEEPTQLDESFEGGYQTWRDALDKGEAGVFTIPPSEVVNMIAGVAQGDS